MVYSYNGVVFSKKKKNELLIYTTIWVNLKTLCYAKEARQKSTYCMKSKNRYY